MELSAKHSSGEALSMEASREFSRTPRRLPPCSDVSVLQKTCMSHFWDTHHTLTTKPRAQSALQLSPNLNIICPDYWTIRLRVCRNIAASILLHR